MKKIVIPRAAMPLWGEASSSSKYTSGKSSSSSSTKKTSTPTYTSANGKGSGGQSGASVSSGSSSSSSKSSSSSSSSSKSSSSSSSSSKTNTVAVPSSSPSYSPKSTGGSSSSSSSSSSSTPKTSTTTTTSTPKTSSSSSSSKVNTAAVPSANKSYSPKATNTAANPASSKYYNPNVSQASRYSALAKSLTAASKKRREEDEALGYSMSPYLIGGNSVNKNYSNQPTVLDRYNSGMKSGAVGGKIQGRSQTTGATYLPQNGQVTNAGRYLRIDPDQPTGKVYSTPVDTTSRYINDQGYPVSGMGSYNDGTGLSAKAFFGSEVTPVNPPSSNISGITTPATPRPDYAAVSGATYLPGLTTPYSNPASAKAVLDSWNNKKAAAANPAALPMYATQEQLDKAGIKLPGTPKAPEPGDDGKGGAGAGANLTADDLNRLRAAAEEAGMELTDEEAEAVYDLTLQDSKDLYELGKEDLLAYINMAKEMNLSDYQQTERALSNAGANTLFNIQQAQRNNFGAYTSPEMLGAILAANLQGNQSYINDLNGSLQELLTLYYNNRRDLNDQVANIPTNASNIGSNIIQSPAEVRAQQRYGEYQGNVAAITDSLASKAMQNTALNWAAKGVKV